MGMALLVLAGLVADRVSAQPATRSAPAAARSTAAVGGSTAAGVRPATAHAATPAAGGWLAAGSPFRQSAPGVMKDVDSDLKADETVEHHNITELLYVDDAFDFAKDVPFRHEVWRWKSSTSPFA